MRFLTLLFFNCIVIQPVVAQLQAADGKSDGTFSEAKIIQQKANGFKGIWYMNQPSNDEYVYKYSGGLGTYPANHRPFAIYAPKVNKTFFVFGGTNERNSTLLHNVSYFDHKTGMVANPLTLLDKGTTDAHDNPVISIDDKGYIWIFSTSHGITRPSYIHKSRKPYDITEFVGVNATEKVEGKEVAFNNFSYFQVYNIKGKGFLAVFTKYNKKGNRVIGFNTSTDGEKWGEWKIIAHIEDGHYQVSAERDGKVAIAFDMHPKGKGLNYRTNLHYLQTTDFGKTWTTYSGESVALPLADRDNPALVRNFVDEKLNCYLLDISLDKKGRPAILVISSKGYQAGPVNDPREWLLFQPDGTRWKNNAVTISDNNYDMGSVYQEDNGDIRIFGPAIDGPQKYNPGGEVGIWLSTDKGEHWVLEKQLTRNSPMNHTYVRKPHNAKSGFYAIWADGHGRKPSESFFYFADKSGVVYRLPRDFTSELTKPEPYINPSTPQN